jgi:acetyl/propionyl-CoA carboxylase alpha subunit/acetyl-CoA carboxylase carboxyltransferase component
MTPRPFKRLAVVNRGEAAMRLIHAVSELNESRADPITIIALYTEPERHAMFVRRADEAYCLGPATAVGEDGRRRNGYLDYAALERALVETRADAAWPGWGFVAEHPDFADMCERLGVVFVGPGGDVMRRLGDKIEAKRLASDAGVPVAPWSGGPVADLAEAQRHADTIGFPLMIKAAAGGGGRGIRRANAAEDLAGALASARAEAHDAFGDDTVFMERLVTPARHIEVQIIADGQGAAWAVGVRDCSCQRRNQKVIEESSSPALTAAQEEELREAAKRLALLADYRNAGTVEFLYEPAQQRFSFMEVNARLQVEHPVTEAVTGLDLVKLQLHVAAGGRLEGEPPPPSGHAIEARLNAEDPALGFEPTPGDVQRLDLPTGPGVRVDRGIAAGDTIPPEFDSMVAKVIASGRDRPEALSRLRRALRDTVAVLDGGTTNRAFLLALLDRPELRSGELDTTWLDRLQIGAEIEGDGAAHVALAQAAIELADAEVATDRASFFALARRGRPQASGEVGRAVEVLYRGQRYRMRVWEPGPARRRVELDGVAAEVELQVLSAHERRLTLGGRTYRTMISRQGTDLLVEVDGVPHRIARDDGGLVRSHAPAVVVAIPVKPGDMVAAGDVVTVLESMKMEMSLTAPFAGRVRQVLTGPNVQVPAQTPLIQLEPLDGAREAASGTRVALPAEAIPAAAAPQRCAAQLRRLEWLLLGYDVPTEEVERTLAELQPLADEPDCEPIAIDGEHRLLELYADLRALARPRRAAEDADAEIARSPQEYLHSYLRSLDAAAEGLPERFVALLDRALSRYGAARQERTPALADACYRLYLSQQRTDPARGVVLSILDRRLARADALAGRLDDGFRAVLDHLEAATEGRDAAIADLARELRYAYYDQPLVAAARDAAYAAMEEHLQALAFDPTRPDRDSRVRALVSCPQALAPLLTRRMTQAAPELRAVLLEAMTRRYYRPWPLEPFGTLELDGLPFAATHYERDGRRHHLLTAFIELTQLEAATRALAAHAATVPESEVVVADFYAQARAGASLPSELTGLPANVARVVVAAAEPERGRGMSAVDMVTLSRDGDGPLVEDAPLRGLHPEMAHRLRMWRYSEFALERLPSAEDVYLLHGTARANPKDERLFAIAEVRDLTPVRDATGRVVALPELERMLGEALAAMRRAQAQRPPRERPLWNRVVLHVWPPIDVETDEVRAAIARHARTTGGLGIERVVLNGHVPGPDGHLREKALRFFSPAGRGVVAEVVDAPTEPLQPLDEGARRIIQARRRGTVHPAELVQLLPGEFEELDLDADGALAPAGRPLATNDAGIVVGLATTPTERYPEGMRRVVLLGDPTKALGSVAEPECRRVIAALDLAQELGVPLEWFALSAGAKISMDSGTENMDWVAAVLRRIIEFTQAGGEINVVVTGINVGAQPYWNAEATMLMHTRGILVMTPDSAMVLTGKQSLDYAGGVSAEDNFGIGGYERIMGPNGQAQYWAPDLAGACRILLSHYEHTYAAPGERFPRRAATGDPLDRDVRPAPHHAPGSPLQTVGDVLSGELNAERKLPFDIRSIMRAVSDADHPPLERWAGMRDAETVVVWHAHLGGWPVCMLGIESHPLARAGLLPADGPEQWTSGTLFPRSSKKAGRALNAASGRVPVVVLANLAGFDGSPESMREWQLEFGAEIGRAVVNFRGPIVFCVVSRYHGGAFVVFSQRLNRQLEAVAVEGARASVIGGSAAAGVVFAREVDAAARSDPRIADVDARLAAADGAARPALRAERAAAWRDVRAEKLGEFAARFDATHSVERAVRMGSVSGIVAPAALRPFLVDAVERGIRRALEAAEDARDGRRVADPVSR